MNVMLLSVSVWSGNVTDITPETRDFFHWALGADRAAGRGLRGASVLRERLARAQITRTQHGRADLARRHARARHVAGRNRKPCRPRLFRFRTHVAVLSPGRAHARSRHAAKDSRGCRKSGSSKGGNGASLRRATSWSAFRSATLKAGDRLLVQARRARAGRRHRAPRQLRDRRKSLSRARRCGAGSVRRDTVYAGSMNYSGAITLQVTAAGGSNADRRNRAAAGQGRQARNRATCVLPIAPPGSMRRLYT